MPSDRERLYYRDTTCQDKFKCCECKRLGKGFVPSSASFLQEDSREVKKAEPRQTEFFQQALLKVLLFHERQLLGFHFAAVGCQLAVELAADFQHQFFRGVACQER